MLGTERPTMEDVLTGNIWKQAASYAKSAKRRLVAVAYMTSDRNLMLMKNDVLICDASDEAIKSNQTSARIIKALIEKGVEVRSLPNLHAKAAVFGRYALIGSSNLSASSEDDLTELALFTDRGQIVAQVTAFIHGLRESAQNIDESFLQRILKIKVNIRKRVLKRKRNSIRLGKRTWLVSCQELAEHRYADEQKLVDSATEKAASLVADTDSTISWIRWTGSSKFRADAQAGDRIVQISKNLSGKRVAVIAPCAIVLRQDKDNWTRFYFAQPEDNQQLSWTQFSATAAKRGLSFSKSRTRELKSSEIVAVEMLLA